MVLIPALDPDEQLLSFVTDLLEKGFRRIVVVNDGSSQDRLHYFDKAKSYGCTILTHAQNRGKGCALKTGFQYILDTYDWKECFGVITADADGQHSFSDVVRVAEKMFDCFSKSENRPFLILGTRDFKADCVPLRSKLGNRITVWLFRVLFGRRIQDTQTGLRGISINYLRKCIELQGERYDYETAMLVSAVADGVSIEEIEVETIYINRNNNSHYKGIKDSLSILRKLL